MQRKDSPGIQHLEEMREIDKLIRKLEEQIVIENEKLINTAVKYKEMQIQTSGTKDMIGEKGPMIADIQREVRQYIQELKERKKQTLTILKQMSVKHQHILISYYMQNRTMEEIEEEMNKSYTWVNKEKKKAVDEFEKIYKKIHKST